MMKKMIEEKRSYFLDSYAIIEIIKGNKNYAIFLDYILASTKWNLFEVYYFLLKMYGENEAINQYNNFITNIIDIKDEHIFAAAEFRFVNTKNDISYIDALGYKIAEIEGFKFLTGDKEFKNMPNVEFVI